MKLLKLPDNSIYVAKMGDRRIGLRKMKAGGVEISIKRTIKGNHLSEPKEIKVKGKKTFTIDLICVHAVDKKTAELMFQMSDEAGEAMLALLTSWFHDHIEDKKLS